MEEREAVRVFKALGDEKRLRILSLLRQGERCACVLLEDLNLSHPTLSHHMKILCAARPVSAVLLLIRNYYVCRRFLTP